MLVPFSNKIIIIVVVITIIIAPTAEAEGCEGK
jgi:hypothetical protein